MTPMLLIELMSSHIIPAAYALLPDQMASPRATAMLLAIGLQESKFRFRRQQPTGPARGVFQFEAMGGVKGVLTHQATKPHIEAVLSTLRYDANVMRCHQAIEHNDVLACVFARLLLWTLPSPLPFKDQVNLGWEQYLEAWRPGRPHPDQWPDNFHEAWVGLP